MSASKQLLFGKDETAASYRTVRAQALHDLATELDVRVPMRRRNPLFGRRWDPLWPGCLQDAARDLAIRHVIVEGLMVGDPADAERIAARAQALWEERARGLPRRART